MTFRKNVTQKPNFLDTHGGGEMPRPKKSPVPKDALSKAKEKQPRKKMPTPRVDSVPGVKEK